MNATLAPFTGNCFTVPTAEAAREISAAFRAAQNRSVFMARARLVEMADRTFLTTLDAEDVNWLALFCGFTFEDAQP